MENFPILQSSRLKRRKLQISDYQSLIKNVNNPKISKQLLNIPFPYTEEFAIFRMNFINQAFENKERYIFAITQVGFDTEIIGEIGIHLEKAHNKAEIGYWVCEDYWGQGIASEAVGLILKFGFEVLNLNKIIATHYLDNPSSEKVLIKNNMIKEATLIEHYVRNDKYESVNQYRLTNNEYKKLQNI